MSYRHLLILLGAVLIALGMAERGWVVVAAWLGCWILVRPGVSILRQEESGCLVLGDVAEIMYPDCARQRVGYLMGTIRGFGVVYVR